jgi:hypothetical protein
MERTMQESFEAQPFLRGSSVWMKKKTLSKDMQRKVSGQAVEYPHVIISTPESISLRVVIYLPPFSRSRYGRAR